MSKSANHPPFVQIAGTDRVAWAIDKNGDAYMWLGWFEDEGKVWEKLGQSVEHIPFDPPSTAKPITIRTETQHIPSPIVDWPPKPPSKAS